MIIAMSGVDGAGKSTVVHELATKLSTTSRVTLVRAGRPQTDMLEQLRRRLRKSGTKSIVSRQRKRTRVIRDALPSVLLGWMRLRLSRRARRLAESGVMVISDRWPTREHGKMDGPKIATDLPGIKGYALRLLARWELAIYHRIEPADIAFYLVVDEETAIQRNADRVKEGKETTEDIIRRHRENQQFKPIAHRVEKIENNGTLDEVLATLEIRIKALK